MMFFDRRRRTRGHASQLEPLIVVVLGVSGSGKTTVGKQLARKLACPFYDADSFHPRSNIRKMSDGTPLTDSDREPWLERLHELLCRVEARDESAVLACSALKEAYRKRLA